MLSYVEFVVRFVCYCLLSKYSFFDVCLFPWFRVLFVFKSHRNAVKFYAKKCWKKERKFGSSCIQRSFHVHAGCQGFRRMSRVARFIRLFEHMLQGCRTRDSCESDIREQSSQLGCKIPTKNIGENRNKNYWLPFTTFFL